MDKSSVVRLSSEVKQRRECSQRYHFSVACAREPEKLLVLTYRNKRSVIS